jgi:rhodanese-related sulfurtransferase
MRAFGILLLKASLIAMCFGAMGLICNMGSDQPVPWVYEPRKEMDLAGVRVQLIDEKQAAEYLDDLATVFVDSRKCSDYAKSHVKGAVCLPPDDVEERFPSVEPLIPPESRVILYCYGPECDMAEKVGTFLAQMGYKNMMIMTSGFPAWEKAKFPIDGRTEKDTAKTTSIFGRNTTSEIRPQIQGAFIVVFRYSSIRAEVLDTVEERSLHDA